jgi:limonene-1,2-epoxide hydrolase
MSKNSEIVGAMLAAWQRKDLDGILSFFSDDAVYINVPIEPPNKGKDMIRSAIQGFLGMASALEFVVHHQGETADGRVLNERTDRFRIGDRWIELPVMGIFEFRGGKISGWRDYFDMGQWQKQMPA